MREHTVVDYLRGSLALPQQRVVEDHIDGCGQCRQVIAALVASVVGRSGSTDSQSAPGRVPAAGETLGRHRVESLLGRGSMGVVVAAYDPALRRRVAIKLLDVRAEADARRAREEARALAALRDPNVVTVYDVGETDGRVFLVMELLEGKTLRHWLQAQRRPRAHVLRVFEAAARGLLAAHAAGIVHRDFKPDNVFIADDEGGAMRVVVGDFGLAMQQPASLTTTSESGDSSAASVRTLVGTPAYMAPEQMKGGLVDERADQFAFCVALWEALIGARPFDGTNLTSLAAAIARGPDTRALVGVSPRLRRALVRGLAADPGDRYRNLRALLAATGARRPPWRSAVLGGTGAAVLVGIATLGPAAGAGACSSEVSAALWSDSTRATLTAQLRAPLDFDEASELVTSVVGTVDDYVGAWTDAHDAVCEAPAPEPRALACLEALQGRLFAALPEAAAIEATSPNVLMWTIDTLPKPGRCTEAGFVLPDPAAPEAKAVRATLAESFILALRGDHVAAMGAADEAQRQAAMIDDPGLQAQVAFQRGSVLDDLGQRDSALPEIEHAYWTARRRGNDALAGLAARQIVALVDDDREAVMTWAGHAEAALRRSNQSQAPLHVHVGLSLTAAGDPQGALAALDRALEVMKDEGRGSSEMAATAHINAALALGALDRWEAAIERSSAAVAMLSLEGDDDSTMAAMARVNLGANLANAGRYREAIEPLSIAAVDFEARLPPTHPHLVHTLASTGIVALEMGELEFAGERLEKALGLLEETVGPHDLALLSVLDALGRAHSRSGDALVGRAMHRRALEIASAAHGPDHPTVAQARLQLAQILLEVGAIEPALDEFSRAVNVHRRTEGETAAGTLAARSMLAWAMMQVDPSEARVAFDAIVEPLGDEVGRDHPTYGDAVRGLAEAEHELGNAVASSHRARSIAIIEAALPSHHPLAVRARAELGTAASFRINVRKG